MEKGVWRIVKLQPCLQILDQAGFSKPSLLCLSYNCNCKCTNYSNIFQEHNGKVFLIIVHRQPSDELVKYRGLYNKTFYCSNCCRIVISQSVCYCQSLPPQPNICKLDLNLLEWSPLQNSPLCIASQPFLQILDQGGSSHNGKHSSLLQYGNNYCRKKFYSTGPRGKSFTGLVLSLQKCKTASKRLTCKSQRAKVLKDQPETDCL